jgi:hypothetical protein
LLCLRICCHTDILATVFAYEPRASRVARIAALATALVAGLVVAALLHILTSLHDMVATTILCILAVGFMSGVAMRCARHLAKPPAPVVGSGMVSAVARRRRIESSKEFLEQAKDYITTSYRADMLYAAHTQKKKKAHGGGPTAGGGAGSGALLLGDNIHDEPGYGEEDDDTYRDDRVTEDITESNSTRPPSGHAPSAGCRTQRSPDGNTVTAQGPPREKPYALVASR